MDLIPFDDFPGEQQQIILFKIENPLMPWKEWMSKCDSELQIHFTPLTLGRFVKKTAMGLTWEQNSDGGRNPFLCPTDFQKLKEMALDRCQSGTNYIELDEFLEMALELKTSRLLLASKFLKFINCAKFASLLNADEELEPSRQWINNAAAKLELSLDYPTSIEEERFSAGSKKLIRKFYQLYKQLIETCPRQLLFGADETMLKSMMKTKVISNSSHDSLLRKTTDIPHITGMCCHTCTGKAVPPMIILPNSIQNLPVELQEFENAGLAWFASSKSGWMNRDIFLVWVIQFINWLSFYRITLPQAIRNARALLVMDGHGSRECPVALDLLRRNGIDVLILPAHTTHITQMFDVGLAASLKKSFAKNMQKMIKESPLIGDETSQIAKLRYCAVASFISAWQSVATFKMCMKAASKTGWYPYDEEAAASSKYAEERTDEQDNEYLRRRAERTRLDINARVINTEEFIETIVNAIGCHPHLSHLCQLPPPALHWYTACKNYCPKKLMNGSNFLSQIHPFVDANGTVGAFH